MFLEVSGVSTANKGAELMLAAIVEHYAGAPNIRLAVDRQFGTLRERAKYGVITKLDVPESFGSRRRRLKAAVMQRCLRGFGSWTTERDISGVIDASGFAFGDQLGPERSERFARDLERWKGQGKKVILLPQALGPFESERLRESMKRIVEHADLIYAREPASLEHMRHVVGDIGKVRIAPDFTCLVKAAATEMAERLRGAACIVPNHRMIEKTAADDRDSYLPFLAACLRELDARDLNPYILLHDTRIDESIVSPLAREYQRPLRVVQESDPKKLKAILGTARLVVGSRFHALVSALSQGVPTIAVGWSHKYEMLLADYGCPECRLSPSSGETEIRKTIGLAADDASRLRLIKQLSTSLTAIIERVLEMWHEVDSLLQISAERNSEHVPNRKLWERGLCPSIPVSSAPATSKCN